MGRERHYEHESPQDHRMMRGPHGHHDHHDLGGRGRWGGERGGWGGGRRMRRGDIRRVILTALAEHPAHGYEIMRRLEEMSGGRWRPSPGSVYPHLQMLEDEGMVRSTQDDGTRTFDLTDKGKAEAAKDPSLPWQEDDENDDHVLSLRQAVIQLMSAAKQLSGAGEESQVTRGIAVITKARKELYQILAED